MPDSTRWPGVATTLPVADGWADGSATVAPCLADEPTAVRLPNIAREVVWRMPAVRCKFPVPIAECGRQKRGRNRDQYKERNKAPSARRRGFRTILATLVIGAATSLATILGAGSASAVTIPNVVGMSEADACQAFQNDRITYITLLRSGVGTDCVISNQYNHTYSFTHNSGDQGAATDYTVVGVDVSCS